MSEFLGSLFALIKDRQENPVAGSYTNSLFDDGLNRITQKVGEEAVEVLVAAHGQSNERLIEELADLTYHSLVLLAHKGLSLDDVMAELEKRHKPR